MNNFVNHYFSSLERLAGLELLSKRWSTSPIKQTSRALRRLVVPCLYLRGSLQTNDFSGWTWRKLSVYVCYDNRASSWSLLVCTKVTSFVSYTSSSLYYMYARLFCLQCHVLWWDVKVTSVRVLPGVQGRCMASRASKCDVLPKRDITIIKTLYGYGSYPSENYAGELDKEARRALSKSFYLFFIYFFILWM